MTDYPIQVVGAAIVDCLKTPSRLLVAQRSAPKELAGLWEFPGGKVEAGESCEQALERELMEELGVRVHCDREILGTHPQGWVLNEKAAMRVFIAVVTAGHPQPLQDHRELRWVSLGERDSTEILTLPWIPADLPIVHELLDALRQR